MQIIVHIGQQKTASTAIQWQLAHNRQRLAAQGVLFPAALGNRKARLLNSLHSDDPAVEDANKDILKNIHAEFSGEYSRAIISNEDLFTRYTVGRLLEIFGKYATSWKVYCYVRRPDEHFPSQYQQKIKGGMRYTFEEAFNKFLTNGYYCYTDRIERWSEAFGKDAVEVRVFHRKILRGNPFEDFIQWVGLDPEDFSFVEDHNTNESFDRLNTEILRFLNLCRVEQPNLLLKYNLNKIQARLQALDTGDRLRLDTDQAKRLQEQFREDHERLADRYLSPEQAAVLLTPPTEVSPQPPLDRHALFERMMTLFNDRDFARLAVERAAQ